MRQEVIKRRTKLDQIAIDSVATAHGKAGLEVYIGRHGMAFAEEQMKINEVVDMSTGGRTKEDLNQVAKRLTTERQLADAAGVETQQPVLNTEPGLSMEMARHFQHDIVESKIFDVTNAVVKAAKYLDRSYKALDKAGGQPADAGLADFAKRVTELANTKPQTKAVRDTMMQLISDQMGSPPRTVWDMGTNKLVLTIDAGAVERFHQSATKALWDTVRQGSTTRTNELDQRLRDLLDRQKKGDKVDEDVAKLRQEMVDLVDMVEAEIKAAHGADIPIEVQTNNAKVRAMLDTLSKRFGVKNLSADELKDKKFVEELLKAQAAHPDPSRLRMLTGYIMDRTARTAELSMSGVEKTNQLLDIIDDRLLGPLRGDSDFAEFEAEMVQVRQANMDPRLRSEAMGRLSTVKTKVASAIKGTNLYLNEKLQATAAGRQGMKFMMVYGLVDEMQSYRDAFNDQGWGGFATEIFKRRIPFGGAVESAVMGNTLRAGWDVVTTLIPPLGLPEAAYGLGTMIGTQVKSTYWSEQLALFTDGLYADAIFKIEDEQQYEKTKVNVYRLVRTFYREMPLDLHRFAEMRKDQVEALSKEVEKGHVNWQAYKDNFNGLTEWLDVDATLKANLAASDPALMLLEEMANHPAVGPKLMDRLAEKGLARWEQVKLGYVTKLIKHLEDRKQADDALGRGALPELFAELRKVAADLGIEDEVMLGLDSEVDTSNMKNLMNWLWDAKRYSLGQPPTESETSRAAQAVKKYLDAYKQLQAMRDQAATQLDKNAATDVKTRYLTSNLFLTGRADPDLAAGRAWLTHIETSRKNTANALLAIKRGFLPKAGLDSNDQSYLDRAFTHELWIKPYQDGNARLKKAWMLDYASGHIKERDKVLAEYKDWLTKLGPVQLTVTAVDAKDSKKTISGLKIALTPTDELGQAVSASAAGNRVIAAVPMGRYSLTASAPGYLDASKSVVYGRGLSPTPSETLSLTPSGKDPDKDKDKDKDKKDKTDGKDGTGIAGGVTDGKDSLDKPGPAKQGAGGSVSGQFPGEPFNGMQISYSVSGCSLPEMKDSSGFTTSRSYKGRLGSGTLTVSGSARMGSGYGATLFVYVNAGAGDKEHKSYIKSGWPGYNSDTFNLSVPIPANSTSASFSIRMSGEYNAGGRALEVSGSCTADGPDGPAPKGSDELSVTLSGPKEPVPLGKDAEVSAQARGGRFPYRYVWTGAAGNNESAKARMDKPGSKQVAVTVSDSDGQRAGANLTIKVAPLKLELAGLPGQAYYGSRSQLQVKGLPDFQPTPAVDPCAGRTATSHNPYDECATVIVDPSKAVSVAPQWDDANLPTIAPDTGAKYAPTPAPSKEGPYRFVWQSEPGLTFDPGTSTDGTTWVTFDRMGQVKVWCEVSQMIEGSWQTIGETDQKTINVVAPAFSISFDPADGQAKVGQEVRAKIVAKPEVPAKLIDYRWFEPASSNRMEYTDNAGEIGFKVKDAKPIVLDALARVPHYGDEIAKIKGSYTGVAYEVKIGAARANGPQLQVWVCNTEFGNAQNCGMKDIPRGQFATFQDLYLQAEVVPAPQSPRYQWTVSPSGSCGLPGSGSELHLNCSNTGSYAVHLQVRDADNLVLGEADTSVSVSANGNDVKQAPKSKEAYDKMQQAKQQAGNGQLDEAIASAGSAAALDSKNAEARDLGKRWSDERNTVRQQVDRAKKSLQNNKPDDAQKEIDAAKKLQPKYPPVIDAEKQIADKRKTIAKTAAQTTTAGSAATQASSSPAAAGLAGAWSINANGYKGKIEFTETNGHLSGRVWYDAHQRWEALENISFDGRTVRFLRPGSNQLYTGTVAGNEIKGGFSSGGTGYQWSSTRSGDAMPAVGSNTGNAAGNWKTSEGSLTLNQNGRSVTGSYSSDGGEIVGEMNGDVLDGYWIENGSSQRCATPKNGRYFWGRIHWTFSDGQFTGTWSYCDNPVTGSSGNWTGERIGAAPVGTSPVPGGREYTSTTPPDQTSGGPQPVSGKGLLVLEDDAGPYKWIDSTEVQTRQVHAGRAAFKSNGNDHFTQRLGLVGNYPGQYRYLDFWLWFDNPEADIQIQVQADDDWTHRWGFDAGPKYNGYGWAMKGATTSQPSGRWLHQRLDLIGQLGIDAGQAITGMAFSSDGADVYYDSVYLLPADQTLPPPDIRPTGKQVLEDDAGPYKWIDATVVQTDFVGHGRAAFRSNGNDHFTADLGIVGDYPEQFRTLSLWVLPIGPEADIQIQVQADGDWTHRWGFDAGPAYNGYGWAMKGTTTGLKPGVWQPLKLDLIGDLGINPGQKITGMAFSSDGADVYYDSVYLLPNPSPAVKPSFRPAGKRVLEDDAGGYSWADASEIQDYLVFSGSRAFKSNGNDHFTADLGVAGNGAGQFRSIGFWAFFMGPEADIQLQVQASGDWDHRWGFDAGPKYNGYGWAMKGATANMASGRWTWIQVDLLDQLKLKPGDKITGLAFSSDGADVVYDSVYLLPSGATPGVTTGTGAGPSYQGNTGYQGSSGAGLRLERDRFAPGEAIVVQFTAPGGWPDNAWVGIVPSNIPHGDERQNDNHDISYQYLKKRTSGSLTFTAPGVGDWDFRLHDTDDNGKEQASVSFRVGNAPVPGGRDYTSTTTVTPAPVIPASGSSGPQAGPSSVSFENGNIGGVSNGPTQPTTFTLNEPRILTLIQNYHWNSARGAAPGTIALRGSDGRSYGPWQTAGTPGQE